MGEKFVSNSLLPFSHFPLPNHSQLFPSPFREGLRPFFIVSMLTANVACSLHRKLETH